MFSTPRRSQGASSVDVLCHTFQYLSKSTWSLLRRGRKQGVPINEETITNLLMLRLQETASPHLRVRSFSKKQESRTGADWEWWLGAPGNWVGFRLQAKVINFNSDSFEHLYYVPTGGVPQYQRLLDDALRGWPKRIPLYCLYVHWERSIGARRSSRAGCSLLSPMIVRGLARTQKRRLVELYAHTTPWHELVCPSPPPRPRRALPPQPPVGDQPDSARESLVAAILRSSKQFYEEIEITNAEDGLDPIQTAAFQDLMRDVRPTNDVPNYVLAIRAGEQPVIDDPQLNSVTVFEELTGRERTALR
jgi:hypothetical protein